MLWYIVGYMCGGNGSGEDCMSEYSVRYRYNNI